MGIFPDGFTSRAATAFCTVLAALSLCACNGKGNGNITGNATGNGTVTGTGNTSGNGNSNGTIETPASFPAGITLSRVAGGFNRPLAITHAGDGSGRIFVVEQNGTIRIVRNGSINTAPFLDISSIVNSSGSEQGLLGLAFPPDFATRRTFYVNYTDHTAVGNIMVARFGLGGNPDLADPASRRTILTIVQPFANHNGGQLAFGPDNLLYIGTGDGGSGGDPQGNGQNKTTLLGKLLRINVLENSLTPYTIPTTNPFGNEIWAYGLRNPWRFSFDRATGGLFLADVGQGQVEEVNFQPAGSGSGANYGWNIMEGSDCFSNTACNSTGLTLPVTEYRHGNGDCSITGGYVYRGSSQGLRGIYLYGDFCSGRIWGLRKTGGNWESRLLSDTAFQISTFGEDEAGDLYLADYGGGDIYRITAQ